MRNSNRSFSIRLIAAAICCLLAVFIVTSPRLMVEASNVVFSAYGTVQNAAVSVTQRRTLNFVNGGCVDNAGTQTTDCTIATSGGGGLVTFAGEAVVLSGGTGPVYVPLGGGGLGSLTETDVQSKVQTVTTFSNACVRVSAAPGGADSITVRLRAAASNTTIVITLTAAQVVNCDTTHTFTNAAGDSMDWSIVPSGVIALYTPNVTIVAQVGSLTSGSVAASTAFNIAQYASNGSTVSGVAVPDCPDTGGNHLNRISATGVWSCGTSGSGGSSIAIGSIASLPASCTNDGDTYYTTDGLYIYVCLSTAFQAFYGSIPVVPPIAANFSWVNQGTASFTAANGGQTVSGPNTAGTQLRARVASVPATPWTADTFVSILSPGSAISANAGLMLRESGTGKIETINCGDQTTNKIQVLRWTNATTFASLAKEFTPATYFMSTGMWIRAADDGANITYSLSLNGLPWITLHTEASGSFFTTGPDQIGVYFDSESTGQLDQAVSLIHLKFQ